MSRIPSVVITPTMAPRDSSIVFVAVVVPWRSSSTSRRAARRSTPSTTARDGSSGVVGSFATSTAPVSVSARTTSVNVPPTSTPIMRMAGMLAAAGRLGLTYSRPGADDDGRGVRSRAIRAPSARLGRTGDAQGTAPFASPVRPGA